MRAGTHLTGRDVPGPGGAVLHRVLRTHALVRRGLHARPVGLALAIDPSLATLATTRVEVETDGTWTNGMTVTDLDGIRHGPWPVGWEPRENARVALQVDAARFMAVFVERLRSLVEAQS